jgi:hypothetical protein
MVVTDANGNPLCDGTTISVTMKYPPDVTGLSFDLDGAFTTEHKVTIPNAAYARYPGSRITDFSFRVVDNSQSTLTGFITVNITINVPGLAQNGTMEVTYPISVRVY